MVASLRYHDTFVKRDGAWLFAERKLYVDWTETRTSSLSAERRIAYRSTGREPRHRLAEPEPAYPILASRGSSPCGARRHALSSTQRVNGARAASRG